MKSALWTNSLFNYNTCLRYTKTSKLLFIFIHTAANGEQNNNKVVARISINTHNCCLISYFVVYYQPWRAYSSIFFKVVRYSLSVV